MANKDFKSRVAAAVRTLVGRNGLLKTCGNALYTPMHHPSGWKWMAFSEPDGILAKEIAVAKGDPAKADVCTRVWLGVLVQSEESTSSSLLNPWGKACIPRLPGGVWVDVEVGGQRVRNVLTFAHVLLVTPEPTSTLAKVQKEFRNRRAVLERVDAAAEEASLLIVPQGRSAADMGGDIWANAQQYLG
jgi:hypothetical protein